MIHYTLVCADGHEFDGWFRGSAGYEEQVHLGVLVCPECGSSDVSKGIMAPNIAVRGQKPPETQGQGPERRATYTQMRRFVEEFRAHVEKNCDYVGDRFPEEARKIHYGETEHRNIYGDATWEEAGKLAEEGVEVFPLPLPPRSES